MQIGRCSTRPIIEDKCDGTRFIRQIWPGMWNGISGVKNLGGDRAIAIKKRERTRLSLIMKCPSADRNGMLGYYRCGQK